MKTISMVMAFLCVLGSANLHANQKLNDISNKVAQHAAEIDQKHGVLLDYSERNDLKLDLIATQALKDAGSENGKTVSDIADATFVTYEVTDPYEQRKLLIKIQAQAAMEKEGTGTSGNEPDYP